MCVPVQITPNSVIPDNRAEPTCFTLPVTRTGIVSALSLRLGISHTYVSDLKIQLRSPHSTTLTLVNRPGIPATRFGDSSDLRAASIITFSDSATANGEQMGNTIGGTAVICRDDGRCVYLPNPDGDVSSTLYSLAGFAGESSIGDWQVCLSDLYPKDVGTLASAQLDLTCSAAPAQAALPEIEATVTPTVMVIPTPTPELVIDETGTPPTTQVGTPDIKIEPTATATLSPDIDLDTLDKPEEPDLNWNVYMPLLTRSESFEP